jgi:excisionase family DNA binding protein
MRSMKEKIGHVITTNLITTKEAAKIIGVTPRQVRRMIHQGRIEGKKIGRDLFVLSVSDKLKRRRNDYQGN